DPSLSGERSRFSRRFRRFLPLTLAFCGATNHRKTSFLVVSLLTNCKMQSASEAADLPGRAGLLSRRRYCHATPHPPREVRTNLFSPPFYFYAQRRVGGCFNWVGPPPGPHAGKPPPLFAFPGPLRHTRAQSR